MGRYGIPGTPPSRTPSPAPCQAMPSRARGAPSGRGPGQASVVGSGLGAHHGSPNQHERAHTKRALSRARPSRASGWSGGHGRAEPACGLGRARRPRRSGPHRAGAPTGHAWARRPPRRLEASALLCWSPCGQQQGTWWHSLQGTPRVGCVISTRVRNATGPGPPRVDTSNRPPGASGQPPRSAARVRARPQKSAGILCELNWVRRRCSAV